MPEEKIQKNYTFRRVATALGIGFLLGIPTGIICEKYQQSQPKKETRQEVTYNLGWNVERKRPVLKRTPSIDEVMRSLVKDKYKK